MKNNDVNDPLKEKNSDQPQEESKKEEQLREELENKGNQASQEGQDASPAGPEDPESGRVRSETPPEPADKPEAQSGEDTDKPEEKPEDKPEEKSQREKGKTSPHRKISLIDDQEEQMRNKSYDEFDRDDHDNDQEEEEQDDQDEHEESEEEEERVNYSLLSKEDLVKLMREKLDHPGKVNLRREVEEIREAFYQKHNAEIEKKKEKFLEEGGNLEDFKPVEDPLEAEMKELLKKYRSLKAEHTRQLEKTKLENLQKKQQILEQFRDIMEGQERFETTFRKFKDLQKKWFSIGIVPQQNLKDLWDSYNYFVDKFNDYVRINRELRALDLKKNLELKVQLCEKAEALEEEDNVVQAFRTLQKYHARWREIGPVPRENRDELWDRFKKATSVINRRHQEYHARLKESLQENLERKRELCEKVEAIAENNYNSHRAWSDKTNQILEIQKTWKTIGYAPKKENNAIYARFRRACDLFFEKKAKFYAAAFEEQKENMKLKNRILERAEALSESEDWKETTNELIRLQKQWKEIGPVPRRDSDKLWKRFRSACDKFFNRKSSYFDNIDSTYEDNLKAKEELIREMDEYMPVDDHKKNFEAVEKFQERYIEIGFVPADKKDVVRDQFRSALDRLMKKVGMDESERSIFKFRNRVRGMTRSPRSEMKLNFERDKLMNKLQQLRNDIGVWENNIGFIKQSESSEDTIQEYIDKIESARKRIELLETKIRILDDMENAN